MAIKIAFTPLLKISTDFQRGVHLKKISNMHPTIKHNARILKMTMKEGINKIEGIMKQNFKPGGYNSVSPYFVVDGAKKLINLLVKIFDAEELRKYERPDGTIMHAEIKIDDSVLMFGNSSDMYPPNILLTHIYVPDVDSIFQKAIDLGCVPLEKPMIKEGDPDRRGSFKDFAGNIWSIATQIGEEK